MTDGNESYEIRWEGSINEGKAYILKASDKTLMNEDMQRMKELFNFKSQDTLGNLKGSERLNENKQFDTIWNKTKNINEMTGGFGFTGEGNLDGNMPMEGEEMGMEEGEEMAMEEAKKEVINITKSQMEMLHKDGKCDCGDVTLVYDEK